jgi:predicted XRE-type DNA-binding protein
VIRGVVSGDEKVTRSSGNVFADLEFANPHEELAKAQLVSAISGIIGKSEMTQAQVSKLIRVDQPTVSKLLRGRTSGFTTDRLFNILRLLNHDVQINVRPSKAGKAKLSVDVRV